jgi:hypothetical protein
MANSHRRRRPARSTGKPAVKGVTSSNRRSPLATLEKEEGEHQFDRLSDLPDDVLLNIVERLDAADAARTAALSRRWKQIPAMLSEILIVVGPTDNVRERNEGDVARANATVLGATRSLLERKSAGRYAIRRLCMRFFLGDGSVSICRASANAMAAQKVGVAEFTILAEKEGRRCSLDDRIDCGRRLTSLINDCPEAFTCLTRLKLENLGIRGESEFPRIFRMCQRLEFLHLDNCGMGYPSLLEMEHPRLRELEILRSRFERVDLNWLPELTTLAFSHCLSLHDPLSFGHVPLLHTVSIRYIAVSWNKMLKMSEFLGQATVSNLTLGFEKEKIWVKPEGQRELSRVFSKLRLVNLSAISNECDLTWTMFVLQGAPSLEELCIRVCDCLGIWDEEKRRNLGYSEERKDVDAKWEASDFKHNNLSVLRIFGFQSEDKFVGYARAVMHIAVNLKDIYFHEKPACKVECAYIGRRSNKYPRSAMEKIMLRICLSMYRHPLLRLHFPL